MLNKTNLQTIIIEGITKDGAKFRPSDWAERMSGILSSFGTDHRIHYSPQLRPVNINGIKCVALDSQLQLSHPEDYGQVIEFAQRNNLVIQYHPTDNSINELH